MSNPFMPGKKVSPVGKSLSEGMVKEAAASINLDASKINLKMENQALLDKSKIAWDNKDFVGYISNILRGTFLSVLCDDYVQGLAFAKEFVSNTNPEAATNLTELQVAQIACLYASAIGKANASQLKTDSDIETVVRIETIETSHIHAAAKLVSRFARFNAYAEGTHGNIETLKSFAELLMASSANEQAKSVKNGSVSNVLAASAGENDKRYRVAKERNSAHAYSLIVMQIIYNYCVFLNIGLYDVLALTNLLAKIDAFALYNNSERIADISRMIREDFELNAQYGE